MKLCKSFLDIHQRSRSLLRTNPSFQQFQPKNKKSFRWNGRYTEEIAENEFEEQKKELLIAERSMTVATGTHKKKKVGDAEIFGWLLLYRARILKLIDGASPADDRRLVFSLFFFFL